MIRSIYSNTGLLRKEITFDPGINLIIGRYSVDGRRSGVNGIGKSSLIRLIDFCLLADGAEAIFKGERYEFLKKESHDVVLVLDIQGDSWVIKRQFDELKKVFMGDSEEDLGEYTFSEAKRILEGKFFPITDENIFLEGNRYRTLMNFFIKDDLEHQKRIDPLNFLGFPTNQKEITKYNFFLLGLPTRKLIDFNNSTGELTKSTNVINALEDEIEKNTGKSIEEYRSEKIKVENKIQTLEEGLKNRNFLKSYRDYEDELVFFTEEIKKAQGEYHAFRKKIINLKRTYKFKDDVDTDEIKRAYNEVLSTFGDLVKKNLDEVILFRKNVSENRKKFLIKKEKELELAMKKTLVVMSKLEGKRSLIYKKLDGKGALDRIEKTYESLSEEKIELNKNLGDITKITELEKKADDLEIEISRTKKELVEELNDYEGQQDNLRVVFQEILSKAIYLGEEFQNAYFDIAKVRSTNKVNLPFKIDVSVPKADALGNARLKVVAYDLLVFLNIIDSKRRFPDFLIHDGVFHGISRATLVNTLNLIYNKSLSNTNFQYIATFNEDEIEIPEGKEAAYGSFDFDLEACVKLSVSENPKDTLFGKVF